MMTSRRHLRARRGLTLVEAIMSCLVVAVVLVMTMRLVAATARSGRVLSDSATAADLADGLLAEILGKSYTDPISPATFGIEAGETTTSKANYDDVDDYNGWTQTYTFTGRTSAADSVTASVAVSRATLATPSSDAASESGLKKITVTVKRQNRVLAVRSAWKADAP